MAIEKPTTPTNGANNIPNNLPVFEIPASAKIESERSVTFSIASDAGSVSVSIHGRHGRRCEVMCTGTGPALVGAGFVTPHWLEVVRPSWCVAFEEAGPRLVVGVRGRPKGRYMRLHKHGGAEAEFAVWWKVERGAQDDKYRKRIAELWQRSGKVECKPDVNEEVCDHENPEDRARRTAGLADAMLNQLRGLALVEHKGLKLSIESQQRILRQMAELRRAFAEARVVQVAPKYQTEGNVIGWPGRGRIAQVVPAALL